MTNSHSTPVFDTGSAHSFCGDLADTVDALIEVLNEETRLVRAARLEAAGDLATRKSVVAERYMRAHGMLKSGGAELSHLVPDEVVHLRARHQALETAISHNLAVLATARTVSETLIRGVAESVARHQVGSRQEVYGADARQTTSAPPSRPISFNTAL